jgi:cytoskeletal protein CcmA (bactofilin family)
MAGNYFALNIALIFWLISLLCWSFSATLPAQIFGTLSLLNFTIHAFSNQVNRMFKKKKSEEIEQPVMTRPAPIEVREKEPTAIEKQATTVIASDVCFEGNIVSGGHVYIHGTLKGNVDAKENIIKVMRGGVIEGNITCRELIIDGSVNGQCQCDIVDICENGNVTGTLSYRTLAVKKGGKFSGKAEVMPMKVEKNNVVGLTAEAIDTAVDAKSQTKKSQHVAG